MKTVKIEVEDYLYAFCEKIGKCIGGQTPEHVMRDMLFQAAGHLAQTELQEKFKETGK